MSILQGIWAATVTPLKSDLNVDSSRLVAHIEWLFDQGSHGVVVFGTTGEANSFSVRERRSVIEQLHERGVDMNRIMVGTGCTAVRIPLNYHNIAVDAGCAAVLMLPPFYYKTVSEDGLFDFISSSVDQIDRSTTQVILYHFPKMAGIGIFCAVN